MIQAIVQQDQACPTTFISHPSSIPSARWEKYKTSSAGLGKYCISLTLQRSQVLLISKVKHGLPQSRVDLTVPLGIAK